MSDTSSVWHYYRKLIRLRDEHPAAVYGTYEPLLDDDPHIFAYSRAHEDDRLLVVLNFFDEQPQFRWPESLENADRELVLSNYAVEDDNIPDIFELRPYEARIYRIA